MSKIILEVPEELINFKCEDNCCATCPVKNICPHIHISVERITADAIFEFFKQFQKNK